MRILIYFILGLSVLTTGIQAQDPNFYIFLCFGQSNMAGAGEVESQDSVVNARFQVMSTDTCPKIGRIKGHWYTAVPPLCGCRSGLSPADYFGRTLVDNLPDNIKVGVINVSVPGCKIELFDKDNFTSYAESAPDWMKNMINDYGGNPYQYLVDMARLAQEDGVIKGILLHQGESNPNDTLWSVKVKAIYDNLIIDLHLDPEETPLLAGETVNEDQGGKCAGMNAFIAALPQFLPNSYVIPSNGCTCKPDKLHFSSEGNREFGRRYAEQMLSVLEPPVDEIK
ncbi:MAG: sialate O-acetylesterase [Bacteroidales bacterium]|nr:sialate O-acetylesterase [Bacteroidales bacterium]